MVGITKFYKFIVQFYKEKLRKRKYFMKYAIIAQVILLVTNVVYLIDANISMIYGARQELSHIFFTVLPTFFQVLFMVMYYDTYKNSKKGQAYSKVFPFVVNTIIATNIVYLLTCIIDKEADLYYLITAILQIINTFFLINYTIHDINAFATGFQQVILKVFVYGATISAVLSLYFFFDNSILRVWIALVINAILLIISFSLYDNYMKAVRKRRG